MILRWSFPLMILFFLTGLNCLTAVETRDKYVRLLINEKNGSFSLYYLTDLSNMYYESLFDRRDSSTSFLTVNVNGKAYHLGKSRTFKTKLEKINGNPAVIHESSFLLVSKVFTPVRTISSPVANGIRITINIKNKSGKEASVGLRALIDTHLSEGRKNVPFITDNLTIKGETVIKGASGENYWVTQGQRLSLMGNIVNPFNDDSKEPDFLHFANWKKLNDVPWKATYHEGQPFNSIPYSIGDSAVCYYYEPEILAGGESFKYTIYLTTEDTAWYIWPHANIMERPIVESPTISVTTIEKAAVKEAIESNEDTVLLTLLRFHEILGQFIDGKILLNEQDLLEIEMTIDRLNRKLY